MAAAVAAAAPGGRTLAIGARAVDRRAKPVPVFRCRAHSRGACAVDRQYLSNPAGPPYLGPGRPAAHPTGVRPDAPDLDWPDLCAGLARLVVCPPGPACRVGVRLGPQGRV